MIQFGPVDLCACRNEQISGWHSAPRCPTSSRQIPSVIPDLLARRKTWDLSFKLAQFLLLAVSTSAIPQLQQHHVAEHDLPSQEQTTDPFSDFGLSVRPQGFYPTGGVYKNHERPTPFALLRVPLAS